MLEDMKGMKRVVMLCALLFGIILLFFIEAQAVETVAKGKAELPEGSGQSTLLDLITAEGSASILKSDDREDAKEKAIEMAKHEAVMKVVGLSVNHEIVAWEKEHLSRIFKGKMDELIDHYKIMAENSGEDGFYRVKITAKIKEDAVKTVLMKNLFDDRVIVVTSEKNLGKTLKRHILEHELIKLAKNKGYAIVDYRAIRNKRVSDLVSLIRQGNTEAVKKLGLYYLTDTVVVGYAETEFSQQTKDIYSANATGQVKIHKIGSQKEILSLTKHQAKGFGSNKEKAGIDAIGKGSVVMSQEAMKSLPAKPLKKVKLTIKELDSHAALKKTKEMISRIPYVKNVDESVDQFRLEDTTLYIRTTKGIDYIADRIGELKKFVVRKVSSSELSLEARRI